MKNLTKDRIDDFKRIFAEKLQTPEFRSLVLEYFIKEKYVAIEDFSPFALELAENIFNQDQKAFVDILFKAYSGLLFPFSEFPNGNPFFHLIFDAFYERLSEENREALKNRIKDSMCGAQHLGDQRDRLQFFGLVCKKLKLEMV